MVSVTASANMLEKTAELDVGEYQVDSLSISAKNGQVAAGTHEGVKLYAAGETIAAISDSKSDLPESDSEGFCFSGFHAAGSGRSRGRTARTNRSLRVDRFRQGGLRLPRTPPSSSLRGYADGRSWSF